MSDLIISLNSNVVKITHITNKGEFRGITRQIPDVICTDSVILDSLKFSEFLDGLLNEFLSSKRSGYKLNFLVESENIYSELIELKNGVSEDLDSDAVVEQAKHQLESVDINELYFSHNRLAPFMRHFIGIKKVDLEKYMEIATYLKMELKSVVPWAFLLPKYANALEPSLFITLNDGETVFTLSELSNDYFSKVFNKRFKPAELDAYIHDLVKYERTENTKKVYILGKETVKPKDGFEIIKIDLPNSTLDETVGFEKHLLSHYMLDFSDNLLSSSVNLLNLFPLPTTVRNNPALTYGGPAIAILILLAGVIYGGFKLNKSNNGQLANNNETPSVAGVKNDHSQPVESSTSPSNTIQTEQPKTETKVAEKVLERKELKIMIENGAGIAGLAGKSKTFLEKLGYIIYDIGDSAVTGREATTLKFKKSKIEYKDLVTTDMKEKYTSIVVEEDLAEDSKYDLLIIVGSKVNGL
jgi:hypothetical protein